MVIQRGMERYVDVEWHRGAEMEWAVPHPYVVDKNWEGYLESEESQP